MTVLGPENVVGAIGSIGPLEKKQVIAAESPPPNIQEHPHRPAL